MHQTQSYDDELDIETAVNVAITRAKQKFILVTNISPDSVIESEETKGEIYEKFLSYVKAAALGTKSDLQSVLAEISEEIDVHESRRMLYPSIAEQISEKLSRMGYTVRTYPGGKNARISLAVYDEKKDKYLVGVLLDNDVLAFSDSTLEREIYYPQYLENMEWTLLRVTSRDWWTEPKKVITSIIEAAEYNRSDIKNT